jgi:hypothetical protein
MRAATLPLLLLGLLAHVLGCTPGAPCAPVDDDNPCTDDICEGGLPVHLASPAGTECSTAGGRCDGMGSCVVGCIAATDCPGTDDECQARTCDAGTCGTSFTTAGTAVAAQTPNDCQKSVCDGQGKVTSAADDGDLPLDDGNPCTGEVCTAGAPGHPALDGAACDDGDACTVGDTCQAGACASGPPMVCSALDQCHVAGACDPTTGLCSEPTQADSTACDDSDACTVGDTCQAGACVSGAPVVCAALDQCHVAGTCDPASGACSNPPGADGTACNDGDACTQSDTCQAGACTGANPVACAALDQCHTAGACNPASGTCSNPAVADGTGCNDGDACTQSDTCHAGTCTGASPVACAALDQCHTAGTCNPVSGTCSNPAVADGTGCNDGNACTQTDACQAGTCTGANPVACAAPDQCHVAGTCNPASGKCSNPPAADGTGCNDGDACTQSDTCQAGACTGANPVACPAPDQCHVAGTCNPASGTCSNPAVADGTGCNDGNACTQSDTCQAGACTGGNPKVCAALDQCHVAGTCNPVSGTCSNPSAADGTGCNDGNACTQTDACHAGTCTGASPVLCAALDQCHTAGTCNPASGTCSNPPAADGTGCNDGNACTQTDTCQAGACTGANPKTCAALDQCHPGVCNTASGACSTPAAANGTACNDGNPCTQTDTCQAGACKGSNPVVCTALDACHYAGSCNTTTGTCSNPPADGVPCNDGNACTVGDACLAGACVSGSSVACSGGQTCAPGSCAPPTATWANCDVGLDPSKNGGDLMWAQPLQTQWYSVGALSQLALGPTGDIGLGLLAFSIPQGPGHYGTAAYQRLNGSGSTTMTGSYRALMGGASTGLGWGPLSIAWNNDLLIYVGGTVGCSGITSPPSCPGSVVSFVRPGASGGLPCNSALISLGYCVYEDIHETLTPTGQLTTAPPVTPDGMGGSYVHGALQSTLDLGCGPMVPTSSSSGYVAHLDAASTCLFSRALPAFPAVVADASGAVVSVSSTSSVDLGCGLLAAAPGGSTFVTRLDPAGACVFGRSLAAPGLVVALEPDGSAVLGGVVGATAIDLGSGPLAPLGTKDAVLGELDATGNALWNRRFGSPGVTITGANVSVSAAGNVYLQTGWSGSVDLGGGAISAAYSHTVVGSYAPSGALRWSRGFPITGNYRAGIDGCGALVLASDDPNFNPGTGKILPFGPYNVTVAVVRYAP